MAINNSIFDVVVSGAGMIGATVACLLIKQGLRVALVDSHSLAQWQQGKFSPRVSAINLASRRVFQWLDVWAGIENRRISPYEAMQVWEHETNAAISFSARELGQPQLGYIIENSAIVSALAEKLQQNYNAEIIENATLESRTELGDFLELHLDNGRVIQCRLLVGADGAESHIRKISAIDTRFSEFGQDAIVTDVSLAGNHGNTAWQCFLPTGPVALLPLTDGRCSIVWSCDRDYGEQVMSLDDRSFCRQLSTFFESRLGKITGCGKRLSFPLRQHHASTYIARQTVLVGDAAHITHPLAGQGANIGFMDAAALSQVIGEARESNREFSKRSVLRRYERWRKGENELVLAAMKSFKNVFGSDLESIRAARRTGLILSNSSLRDMPWAFQETCPGSAGIDSALMYNWCLNFSSILPTYWRLNG